MSTVQDVADSGPEQNESDTKQKLAGSNARDDQESSDVIEIDPPDSPVVELEDGAVAAIAQDVLATPNGDRNEARGFQRNEMIDGDPFVVSSPVIPVPEQSSSVDDSASIPDDTPSLQVIDLYLSACCRFH